jgi:ABC-type nitrate/sulfonate/bicarbonate transport system ATPase subunit
MCTVSTMGSGAMLTIGYHKSSTALVTHGSSLGLPAIVPRQSLQRLLREILEHSYHTALALNHNIEPAVPLLCEHLSAVFLPKRSRRIRNGIANAFGTEPRRISHAHRTVSRRSNL